MVQGAMRVRAGEHTTRRYYAGAPLVLAPGIRVGTICVIDVVARRFSAEDCRKLDEFATIVVALLRLRDANVRQRKTLTEGGSREALMHTQTAALARQDSAKQASAATSDFLAGRRRRDRRREYGRLGSPFWFTLALLVLAADAEPVDPVQAVVAANEDGPCPPRRARDREPGSRASDPRSRWP